MQINLPWIAKSVSVSMAGKVLKSRASKPGVLDFAEEQTLETGQTLEVSG
jgi:hypothetical protein